MKKLILLPLFVLAFAIISFASESSLCQFTGKYKFVKGDLQKEIEINFKDGQLELNGPTGTYTLNKSDDDEFEIKEYGIITFTRNAEKKINGIKIKIFTPSLELEGEKISDEDVKVIPLMLPRMDPH